MYHLELRKFPHTVCRFNQGEQQLRAIVVPWVREEWIEEGERGWNMHEATLTVLEGPELSTGDLTMGRGWRNAQRKSKDVTRARARSRHAVARRGARAGRARRALWRVRVDRGCGGSARVLGGDRGARAVRAGGAARNARPSRAGAQRASASCSPTRSGCTCSRLLDAGPVPLSEVWALARERLAQPTAAESLALGEQAVRSLLQRRLGVLQQGDRVVDDGQAETLLRSIETWSTGAREATVIARKT